MKRNFKFDVFISHNSRDKVRVRSLATRLKSSGLVVWFDEWTIQPGDDIFLQIEKGLEDSRILILCMTEASFGSDWVSLERSTILFRDPSNSDKRFIPILLDNCTIPDTIKRFKYIDFRAENETAFNELLRVCKKTELPKIQEESEQAFIFEKNHKAHDHFINSISISRDGNYYVTGAMDDKIKVWNYTNNTCLQTIQFYYNTNVNCTCVSQNNEFIIAATKNYIHVIDFNTGTKLAQYSPHFGRIFDLSIPEKQNVILSAAEDCTIKLTNYHTKKCLKVLKGHKGPVLAIDISPDGKYAASGSSDKSVKFWDVDNEKCIYSFDGHNMPVRDVKLSLDNNLLISSSDDRLIKIWDTKTGKCSGTFEGHSWEVLSLAVSPNKSIFASAGFTDGTVRIWDMTSGKCIQVIESESKSSFISLAFSPDGKYLIAGTALSGTLYFFKISSNETIFSTLKTSKYINAKIVLIGETGVGKTALAYRLKEDRYIKTDSTHGMNAWPIELPLDNDNFLRKEALLWDLAGQEDYRLMHQLYLDETALALVLFNPQSNNPFEEPEEWVNALNLSKNGNDEVNTVAKILIAARIDVGHVKISKSKIDRFLNKHNFVDYIQTSAKDGDNCSDSQDGHFSELKKCIARNIKWDSLPWIASNLRLMTLKDSILKIYNSENVRLIRFQELFQRIKYSLPELAFEEGEVRSIIVSLSNQYLLIKLKYGDLILLQPKLLNNYASAIIKEARNHVDEIGCIAENDIVDKTISFKGVDRLQDFEEDLLLRAIIQTLLERNICISEETGAGRQLIFPTQNKKDKDITSYPSIFLSYNFTGELKNLYATLVVRLWYGFEFENKELWKNAAEFYTSTGKVIGLLIEKSDEGRGTIHIFFETTVPDDIKIIFIGYIHKHLSKYAKNVTRQRRYVCSCGKPVTDLSVIEDRLNDGKEFIFCQKCDVKIPLIDHIENKLKTDPIAAQILGLEEKAERKSDNQAMEQILLGQMLSICGEAGQIFRPTSMFDYGIDGEIEFKDNLGKPNGKKIYVQLKNGASYLEYRQRDGKEIFYVKNIRHLDYWISQPVDVYLVIRDSESKIRWMNITSYLLHRKEKSSSQIVFEGEQLDMASLLSVRDKYINQ